MKWTSLQQAAVPATARTSLSLCAEGRSAHRKEHVCYSSH